MIWSDVIFSSWPPWCLAARRVTLIAGYVCATVAPLAQLLLCMVRNFLTAYRLPATYFRASLSYMGKLVMCIQSVISFDERKVAAFNRPCLWGCLEGTPEGPQGPLRLSINLWGWVLIFMERVIFRLISSNQKRSIENKSGFASRVSSQQNSCCYLMTVLILTMFKTLSYHISQKNNCFIICKYCCTKATINLDG